MRTIEICILILMILVLGAGGFLLWNRRNETNDYSRHVQAMLNWMSSFLCLIFLVRILLGSQHAGKDILEPELIFFPSFLRTLFIIYPLEVIKHGIPRMKLYPIIFSPVVALLILGMFSGFEYTPLASIQDLLQNFWKLNVLFRVFSTLVLLFYCFILFFVPDDLRRCGTDKCFIPRFSLFFCLLGVAYTVTLITHWQLMGFLHQFLWMWLFFSITYWELKERLISKEVPEVDPASCAADVHIVEVSEPAAPESIQPLKNDELWEKILHVMDGLEGWRDPELSLNSLSEQVFSNRTYVGEAFKRNTGMTFTEYVTKRRIDDVVAVLTNDPKSHIQDAFLAAGYRQRSTAWKNFHKLMGVSPTEFVENIR